MAKILVVYDSRTGNTEKMGKLVAKGAREAGAQVDLKKVDGVCAQDLLGYDGIIAGSPTYYGHMSAELKKLFDDSVKYHGELEGKVGGAFSSSANIGGGNETTVVGILQCMLIHGMVVQGDCKGDHYGPVAIGKPDERANTGCLRYGKRIAALTHTMI